MEYEERIKILNWPNLECYKIIFGINNLKFSYFFELTLDKWTRANHSFKLSLKNARVNTYKYSFFIRTVKEWRNITPSARRGEEKSKYI